MRHLLTQFMSGCTLFIRIGECAHAFKLRFTTEVHQFLKILFCFAWEADNESGSQCDTRNAVAHATNQFLYKLSIARSLHSLEHPRARVLERDIDILADLRLLCYNIEHRIREPGGITVEKAHPLDP